jgi:hypothetical protein
VVRKPEPDRPPDTDHAALMEFMRQQREDAKFRARVWATAKRWAAAAVAVGLGVTTGWNLIERIAALLRGP